MLKLATEWEIGKEAKEIDEKPVLERMKIQKRSIIRIFGAICIYFITLTLFYFFL